MTNSRRKGKDGELEAANSLSNAIGLKFRRTQQHNGIGLSDVICDALPQLHVEVKRGKVVNIHKAVEQALRDMEPGQVPMICSRRDREQWLVTVPMDHLVTLVQTLAKRREE